MKKNILLLLTIGLIMILTGCSLIQSSEDEQNCSIEQFLLEQSDYPAGTIFDIIRSPIDEKPRESASRSSYYRESWIRESVIKYRSIDKAYEIFVGHQDSIFSPSEVYDVWEMPLKLNQDWILADQYEIGCGNVRNFGNRCIMLAQYKKYIIFFSVDISENGVTQELFSDLVLKIDDRMSACISQ